jgi:hypothetical protein
MCIIIIITIIIIISSSSSSSSSSDSGGDSGGDCSRINISIRNYFRCCSAAIKIFVCPIV